MSIIDMLKQDHLELCAICAEVNAMLARNALDDPAAFSALRWRLARRVMQHLAVEDQHIYAPAAREPESPFGRVAARLKNEMGSLYADFLAHIADWPGDAVVADWMRYRPVARRLIARLATRITCEDCELYPLIGGAGHSSAVNTNIRGSAVA